MDKKILVENIKNVVASFKEENKDFSFVGLIPVYPDYTNTSYILTVGGKWLDQLTFNQSISIITRRLFELLDAKSLRYINRVEILEKENNPATISDNLIFEDTFGLKNYYDDLTSHRKITAYQVH
jgi:hypothetical protein